MHCIFQCSVVHFNSWSVLYDTCMASYKTLCRVYCSELFYTALFNTVTLHICAKECIACPVYFNTLLWPTAAPVKCTVCHLQQFNLSRLAKKSEPMHPNAIQCSVLWVKIQLSEINALYSLVVLLSTRFTPPPHVFRLSSSAAAAAVWAKVWPILWGASSHVPSIDQNQCQSVCYNWPK